MHATRALRMFQPTFRMMRPASTEGHAASSSFSSRLRRIPPELLPLGIVVAFAVSAATYSSFRHLFVDKNIRLKRQNRAAEHAAEAAHHEAVAAAAEAPAEEQKE